MKPVWKYWIVFSRDVNPEGGLFSHFLCVTNLGQCPPSHLSSSADAHGVLSHPVEAVFILKSDTYDQKKLQVYGLTRGTARWRLGRLGGIWPVCHITCISGQAVSLKKFSGGGRSASYSKRSGSLSLFMCQLVVLLYKLSVHFFVSNCSGMTYAILTMKLFKWNWSEYLNGWAMSHQTFQNWESFEIITTYSTAVVRAVSIIVFLSHPPSHWVASLLSSRYSHSQLAGHLFVSVQFE